MAKRVEYVYKYLSYEAKGVVFVFIDETPFRVMDYSSRGWSPVEQKAISLRKKKNKCAFNCCESHIKLRWGLFRICSFKDPLTLMLLGYSY